MTPETNPDLPNSDASDDLTQTVSVTLPDSVWSASVAN